MRKIIYALAYLAGLVIGICLLVFNQQATVELQPVLRPVIISAGIIFVIPGIYFLLASLRSPKNSGSTDAHRPWFSTIMGAIALIWGILLLCMPGGLLGSLNITCGVSVIIASFAQIIWIVRGRRKNGAPLWLYIIPLLTIGAGVAVMFLKKDFQNPGQEAATGSIISGAALVIWAINGFMSLPRRKKTPADIEKEARKLAKDQEKAIRNEAKEAKERLEKAKANSETARLNEDAARKAMHDAEEKIKDNTGVKTESKDNR